LLVSAPLAGFVVASPSFTGSSLLGTFRGDPPAQLGLSLAPSPSLLLLARRPDAGLCQALRPELDGPAVPLGLEIFATVELGLVELEPFPPAPVTCPGLL
jgi:hypothetical protein